MSHEHEGMLIYTRAGSTEEIHRCACGAAGSKRPNQPVAWFYGGTRYHDLPHSRVVYVLDRAMQRELDELSPARITQSRNLVCAALVTQILTTPEGLPLKQRVVEVNRAIARAFHGLLTHLQSSIRDDAKHYAASLRNDRDVERFEELLRGSLSARPDLIEAYEQAVDV